MNKEIKALWLSYFIYWRSDLLLCMKTPWENKPVLIFACVFHPHMRCKEYFNKKKLEQLWEQTPVDSVYPETLN